MAVICIQEAEAISGSTELLARAFSGTEFVIMKDEKPVAVMHGVGLPRRSISEYMALAERENINEAKSSLQFKSITLRPPIDSADPSQEVKP